VLLPADLRGESVDVCGSSRLDRGWPADSADDQMNTRRALSDSPGRVEPGARRHQPHRWCVREGPAFSR